MIKDGWFMRPLLATALTALALGCSGGGNGGGAGGGSAGGTGGGTGGGAGGGAPANSGSILLMQACTAGCFGFVSAQFPLRPAGCTSTTQGSCTLTDCPTGSGTPRFGSAGAITVTGTVVDGGITLNDFGDGGYPSIVSGRLWTGGETLTVSGAGGTVPAFSGKTVVAPSDVAFTQPACPAGSCGPLSKGTPLTIAWTGGAGASAYVLISQTNLTGLGTRSLACTFTSSPATVPVAALAGLGEADAGFTTDLVVAGANVTTFEAGDFSVKFAAQSGELRGTLDVTP